MDGRFQKRPRPYPDVRLAVSNSGIRVGFDGRGARDAAAPEDERISTGTRLYRRDRPDTQSSNNLTALADLGCEVEVRRAGIARAIGACRRRMISARFWLGIWRLRVFAPSFARPRVAALETALAQLERTKAELTELLDATAIDLDFAVDEEVRSAYLKMVDAFGVVAGAERIWHAAPGFNGRSGARASRSLDLKPVRFAVKALPVFRTALPTMHFGNANGVEHVLMPGFMILRRPDIGLALIEMKGLSIQFSPREAIPAKHWPWDSVRVRKPVLSWLDGDLRAPQEQYGDIEITSEAGLYERFVVSDWRALQAFRHAITVFQKSMSQESRSAGGESASVSYAEIADLKLPALPDLPWAFTPWMVRRSIVVKVAAVTALVACVVVAAGLVFRSGPQAPATEAAISAPAPAAPPPVVAAAEVAQPKPTPATSTPAPAAPPPVVAAAEVAQPKPTPATSTPAPASAPPVVAAAEVAQPKPMPETATPVPAAAPPVVAAAEVAQAKPVPETSAPAPAAQSAEAAAADMPDIVTGAGPTAAQEAAPAIAQGTTQETASRETAPEIPSSVPATSGRSDATVDPSLAAATPVPASVDAAPSEPASAKPAARPEPEKTKVASLQPAAARGLSKAEVTELQVKLYDLGYYYGRPDGALDGITVDAFNAWRSEIGRPLVRTIGRADYHAFLTAISR